MPIVTSRGSGITQTGWVNPQNAYDAGQNTFATFTTTTANITNTVFITGYNFTSIPVGSTINSVSIIAKQYVNVANRWISPLIQAYISDTPEGTQFLGTVSNSSANSNTFSETALTLDDLDNINFQMRFVARKASNTQSSIQFLDYIQISVDYTEPVVNVESWGTIPII
jgi:hypothetical protein